MRQKKFLLGVTLLMLTLLSACGTVNQGLKTQKVATVAKASARPTTASPTAIPTLTPIVSTPTPTPTPSVEVPIRLLIPRIGVNASVEDVGITTNGDLETPQQNPWTGVGWYSNGPRPGQPGSAVINGHLDRPGGYPATFWNLRYLVPGDTVMVLDAQGRTLHFRVLRVASYSPQQAPVQEIFGTTGGNYLNLITCAGTWIPAQHQTTLRLVVYTVEA